MHGIKSDQGNRRSINRDQDVSLSPYREILQDQNSLLIVEYSDHGRSQQKSQKSEYCSNCNKQKSSKYYTYKQKTYGNIHMQKKNASIGQKIDKQLCQKCQQLKINKVDLSKVFDHDLASDDFNSREEKSEGKSQQLTKKSESPRPVGILKNANKAKPPPKPTQSRYKEVRRELLASLDRKSNKNTDIEDSLIHKSPGSSKYSIPMPTYNVSKGQTDFKPLPRDNLISVTDQDRH